MTDMLPPTRELLLELLDGLDPETEALPEVRAGKPSRSGCRYWLYGVTRKGFDGRRPAAQFEELRAAGILRKLRTDKSTGTYYGFTPEAFRVRDALVNKSTEAEGGWKEDVKERPSAPPGELDAAQSRLEILRELRDKAKHSLGRLVAASQIVRRVKNTPGSGVVFIAAHPWKWAPLDSQHLALLGAARDDADLWLGACRTTLSLAAPEHLEQFDELAETVRRMYIRTANAAGPTTETTEGNARTLNGAIDKQFALADQLPNAHEPEALILVPDTNALLKDPNLEDWELGDRDSTIVIVSQAQAELDALKAGDRKVAGKAAGLIRRFKEYGRRGNTLGGVPLAGRRMFREVPIRPDMSKAPPWLEADHPDDRILAAALELAANHLSSRVVLVTRDRGLQNKARAAGLPALDVDDL